jgi:hypothetical protein
MQVLTREQENFALALTVELATQRKPMSADELMRWCAVTAEMNGTRTDAKDLRKWYALFVKRAKRETGIDIQEVETQQLSKQRAGVSYTGMATFQNMVGGLLREVPLLADQGLIATGDWDELKLDLNALLTSDSSLVPAGCEPRWEVEGERSEQITLLAGFVGHRSKEFNRSGKYTSLSEVRAAIKAGLLESFGEVAGYPKLPPGFWDGEDFCILIGLLIFKGKAGADPAWLNLVQDKTRLMVATTESGYINTSLKYQWYKRCKELDFCPFGKRPTIPQCDSHASNESVDMSAEMELEDDAHLVAPPGHSTHLTAQLDQTGGPNQNFKDKAGDMIKHGYRIGGKLSKTRIAQQVELAITLSFTPAVCSHSSRRVGWGQDATGKLTYSPLSMPHIASQLVDDWEGDENDAPPNALPPPPRPTTVLPPTPTTTALVAAPVALTRSAEPSAALVRFRAGEMDGEQGIAAGREAALAVLGRGSGPKDGWANEEDMDEVMEEEGSAARRRALPNGQLLGHKEFREGRNSQTQSAANKEAVEKLQQFKKRRLNERVLEENKEAESQLATKGAISTQTLMQSFVRARTNEPMTATGDVLKLRVTALKNKPIVIPLGMEPDGYTEWKQAEVAAAAAKKAAKARAAAEAAAVEAAAVQALPAPTAVQALPAPMEA